MKSDSRRTSPELPPLVGCALFIASGLAIFITITVGLVVVLINIKG